MNNISLSCSRLHPQCVCNCILAFLHMGKKVSYLSAEIRVETGSWASWIKSLSLTWCAHPARRMELLFLAGLPANLKGHHEMHSKFRNKGLCSGSFSPAVGYLLCGPDVPDTNRTLVCAHRSCSCKWQSATPWPTGLPYMHGSSLTLTNTYNKSALDIISPIPVHRIISLRQGEVWHSRFIRAVGILPKASELFISFIHRRNKFTLQSQ